MLFLPVDTAVVVEVGPLIDDSDFKSLEEAIAYDETNMDVDLFKKSAISLVKTDITLTSGGTGDFAALSQTTRDWIGMAATPNGDVYACVNNGDIYMQTGGTGDFEALGQTTRSWLGMATTPNGDVYACVYNGDIYMQTGGTGDFMALSQTTRNWWGMTAAPNGDVYACVHTGDIYMQTGGTGDFAALSQITRVWKGIAAVPNGDVYACVDNGDIYMQTGGTGDFMALSQTVRNWLGMAAAPNGDVYACVNNGDIYMQTGGTGDFAALSQTTRNWWGMAAAPNGDVYACVNTGDIYMQTGGTNDWTHKGSGVYEVEITAAQNDTEGTLRLVGLCDGVLSFESPVYTVVPQMVYNALVAGSDKLEIDVNQVGGTAVPETSGKLHVLDGSGNAVANESKQDTMDTVVDAIKTVTDNLPNAGALTDLATQALLTTVAGYLDTEIQAILDDTNELQADWTDGGRLDLLIDAIRAVTDNLPNSGALTTLIAHLTDIKGGAFSGATDSLEAIRNRGDAAWVTGGTGGGAEEWEFTLTESGSGEPVADASVWVTADEEGEGEVIVSGNTNNFGVVTFYLDTGTYYFWAEKAGWNFNNPYTQVVS